MLAQTRKGSDTLVSADQAWAEEYQVVKPGVATAVSVGGSGTGIVAVIDGTVDIANASRQMKKKEPKRARDSGQNPLEHVVGYDALAVFIHEINPAERFSFNQPGRIFGRAASQPL